MQVARFFHALPTMFNLVFLLVSLSPLAGLILMESGAYGPDAGMFGYPNGASLAYALHLLVMYGAYAWIWLRHLRKVRRKNQPLAVRRTKTTQSDRVEVRYTGNAFTILSLVILSINVSLLFLLLFVVGAIDVVRGNIDKGLFRSQLGDYGIFVSAARDFITPMLAALLAFVFVRCKSDWRAKILLWVNLVLTAAIGAIWGYRATAVFLLIPAFVLLMRNLTVKKTALVLVGTLITIMLFTSFYQDYDLVDSVDVIVDRATIGAGNSAWRIWDLNQTSPHVFPSYWPTLLQLFGGRLGRALELSLETGAKIEFVSYAALMTMVVKNFEGTVEVDVSNVTGTTFGEGVIALGSPGFLIFSLFAGVVVAIVRIIIRSADECHMPLQASLAATYYMTSVISWLNGGGITILFLFPFLIYYGILYLLGYLLLLIARIPRRDWMQLGFRRLDLREHDGSFIRS